jgi:hypothetical protein
MFTWETFELVGLDFNYLAKAFLINQNQTSILVLLHAKNYETNMKSKKVGNN